MLGFTTGKQCLSLASLWLSTAPGVAWGPVAPGNTIVPYLEFDFVKYTFMHFFLGLLLQLKIDNGLAYTNKLFEDFGNLWNIDHLTKIPYYLKDEVMWDNNLKYLLGKF